MRHLITHPGARTAALYDWETKELMLGKHNPRFTLAECRKFAADFWLWSGRKRERCPTVDITLEHDLSFADGRASIVLNFHECGPVVLTHELVHAKGYGQGRAVHPVSFVREYIECLARHVGLKRSMLIDSAMMRGLL